MANQEVQQEKAKQDELLWTASYSDHEAALRVEGADRCLDAVALSERALRYMPRNALALTASANYMFGANAAPWITRHVIHAKAVAATIAFAPDGRHFAVGGEETTSLVDPSTGEAVAELHHDHRATDIAFSSDNRLLAIAGMIDEEKSRATIFDRATRRIVRTFALEGRQGEMVFSSNLRYLATANNEGITKVIEVQTGKVVHELPLRPPLRFSLDEQMLAGAKGTFVENALCVVALSDATELFSPRSSKSRLRAIEFSQDGKFLALGWDNDETELIDTKSGKQQWSHGIRGWLDELSFSPDGNHLVIGSGGINYGIATVVEVFKGRKLIEEEMAGSIMQIEISPEGQSIALASGESLEVMDIASGNHKAVAKASDGFIALGFSPDGRFLVARGADSTIRILEPTPGQELAILDVAGVVQAISPDRRHRAFSDGTYSFVVVADQSTGQIKHKFKFEGDVTALAYSPDGLKLAVGTRGGAIGLFDTAGTDAMFESLHDGSVQQLAFSLDGRYLIVVRELVPPSVIDVGTRNEEELANLVGPAESVALSTSGKLLTFAGKDKTLSIMEVGSWRIIKRDTYATNVSEMSFSPDSRRLAFVLGEKHRGNWSLNLFDVAASTRLWQKSLDEQINIVRFSASGDLIGVGVGEVSQGKAIVINAASEEEILRSNFEKQVTAVAFSSDDDIFAAGTGLTAGKTCDVRCFDLNLLKVICTNHYPGSVNSLSFGPDGAFVIDHGYRTSSFPSQWLRSGGTASPAWSAALRIQAGGRFNHSGIPAQAGWDDFLQDQQAVASLLSSGSENAPWQREILRWAKQTPEQRLVSPWIADSTQTKRGVAGHCLMMARNDEAILTAILRSMPWHPLVPISLARAESFFTPGMEDLDETAAKEILIPRIKYHTRLTLQRLRDADESIYGREILGEYAGWVAMVIHGMYRGSLDLNAEAQEALTFALERTPQQKQKELLELKAKLEAK